jgi:hypothetical protein
MVMTRTVVFALSIAALFAGIAVGRDLGAREAREQIAGLVGARSADSVRIKTISPGLAGDEAIVEAQIDLAFRMKETKDGWRVADVRLASGVWEPVDLLRKAIDSEKARVASDELRSLATGVETFRGARGYYPDVESVRALVDHVAPRYMSTVVREDPWHVPYYYRLTSSGFAVGSAGPDGKQDTPDDVVVSGGATRR